MTTTLLSAAKAAIPIVQRELDCMLESHCLLDEQLNPRIETLEESVVDDVTEARLVHENLKAAIEAAETEDLRFLIETCERLAELPVCRPIPLPNLDGSRGGYNSYGTALVDAAKALKGLIGGEVA